MATAPRDNSNTEHALLHDGNLSPIQLCDSSLLSHILHHPPGFQSSDSPQFFFDVTASSLLVDSPKASDSSRFGSASLAKAFVSTIDMTDIAMPPEMGPEVNEPTPAVAAHEEQHQTDTVTNTEEDQSARGEESNCRIPPRSSGETTTNTEEGQSTERERESDSRTPPSSSKGHRSTSRTKGSRSASAAGHKASGRSHGKPGLYSAQQSARPERDLVALHRESCRLFESFGRTENEESVQDSPITPGDLTTPNNNPAPADASAASPLRDSRQHDNLEPHSPSLENEESTESDMPERKPIPPTTIDWTLPSTRKREYEKIDRSNRGIRGVWRRHAPRWCQGQQRTPFYVEGKEDKEYEGSVRRFRMDIPDGDDKDEGTTTTTETKRSDSKGGRDWAETKAVRNRDQDDKSKSKSRPRWPGAWRRKSEA